MRRFATVATLAFAGLAGCGGTEEDRYKLVKVTGTITIDGKPLVGAKVQFVPGAGNKPATSGSDQTGEEGNYMLRFSGRTGVVAGQYKVMIVPANEPPAGVQVREDFKDDPLMLDMQARLSTAKAKAKKSGQRSKIQIAQHQFDAEVKDVASQIIDFDVKASSSAQTTAKN